MRSDSYRWNNAGCSLEITITDQGGDGPAWLLLPALYARFGRWLLPRASAEA